MTLDLSTLYAGAGQAKLAHLPRYEHRARAAVAPGVDVVLTGPAPVWMYLRIAHALHGIARALYYESPVTGRLTVFDHSPD